MSESKAVKEAKRIIILQAYYCEHGVLPSYSSIGKLVGFLSKNSVFNFVERLLDCDRLAKTPEGRIKPGINFMVYPQEL